MIYIDLCYMLTVADSLGVCSHHYIIPCLFSEPGRPLYLQIECILSTAAGRDPVGILLGSPNISGQVTNLALVKALNLAQGDCNILEPWLSMAIHGYPWLSMAIHGYPWLSMAIHGYSPYSPCVLILLMCR